MNASSYVAFRFTTLLVAVALGAQCVWLLLAELSRPGIDQLPIDAASATAAAQQCDAALWAAAIGAIRGDLWAQSAYTYADLVVGPNAANTWPNLTTAVAHARASLNRALDDAPTQSGAWLLLAELALYYPTASADATQALKMSYYTGPSEQRLIPIRLRVAAQADKFDDVEIQQFVSRDLRLLVARKQNAAIVEAYRTASADGKHFIEQSIGDFDPSFLDALRASGAQLKSLPN